MDRHLKLTIDLVVDSQAASRQIAALGNQLQSVNLPLVVNSTASKQIGQAIAGEVSRAIQEIKLPSGGGGFFGGIADAVLAPFQAISRGALEGIGKSLSDDLGKGIASGLKQELAPIIGSYELVGRESAIAFVKEFRRTFARESAAVGNIAKELIGTDKIAAESGAVLSRAQQQQDQKLREATAFYQRGRARSDTGQLRAEEAEIQAQGRALVERRAALNEQIAKQADKFGAGKLREKAQESKQNLDTALESQRKLSEDLRQYGDLQKQIFDLQKTASPEATAQIADLNQQKKELEASIKEGRKSSSAVDRYSAQYRDFNQAIERLEREAARTLEKKTVELERAEQALAARALEFDRASKPYVFGEFLGKIESPQDLAQTLAQKQQLIQSQQERRGTLQSEQNIAAKSFKQIQADRATALEAGDTEQVAQLDAQIEQLRERQARRRQQYRELGQNIKREQAQLKSLIAQIDDEKTAKAVRSTLGAEVKQLTAKAQELQENAKLAIQKQDDALAKQFIVKRKQVEASLAATQQMLADVSAGRLPGTPRPTGVQQSATQTVPAAPAAAAPSSAPAGATTDASVPAAYKQILDLVAKASGVQISADQVPSLVADRGLTAQGAAASYSRLENRIRVSEQALAEINQGKVSNDTLKALIHELRHGVQDDFGSGRAVGFAQGVQPNQAELNKVGHLIDRSTEKYRGSLPKEQIRNLETDAYVFAERVMDALGQEIKDLEAFVKRKGDEVEQQVKGDRPERRSPEQPRTATEQVQKARADSPPGAAGQLTVAGEKTKTALSTMADATKAVVTNAYKGVEALEKLAFSMVPFGAVAGPAAKKLIQTAAPPIAAAGVAAATPVGGALGNLATGIAHTGIAPIVDAISSNVSASVVSTISNSLPSIVQPGAHLPAFLGGASTDLVTPLTGQLTSQISHVSALATDFLSRTTGAIGEGVALIVAGNKALSAMVERGKADIAKTVEFVQEKTRPALAAGKEFITQFEPQAQAVMEVAGPALKSAQQVIEPRAREMVNAAVDRVAQGLDAIGDVVDQNLADAVRQGVQRAKDSANTITVAAETVPDDPFDTPSLPPPRQAATNLAQTRNPVEQDIEQLRQLVSQGDAQAGIGLATEIERKFKDSRSRIQLLLEQGQKRAAIVAAETYVESAQAAYKELTQALDTLKKSGVKNEFGSELGNEIGRVKSLLNRQSKSVRKTVLERAKSDEELFAYAAEEPQSSALARTGQAVQRFASNPRVRAGAADLAVNTAGFAMSQLASSSGMVSQVSADIVAALVARLGLHVGKTAVDSRADLLQTNAYKAASALEKLGMVAGETARRLQASVGANQLGRNLSGDLMGGVIGNATALGLNAAFPPLAAVPFKGAIAARAVVPRLQSALPASEQTLDTNAEEMYAFRNPLRRRVPKLNKAQLDALNRLRAEVGEPQNYGDFPLELRPSKKSKRIPLDASTLNRLRIESERPGGYDDLPAESVEKAARFDSTYQREVDRLERSTTGGRKGVRQVVGEEVGKTAQAATQGVQGLASALPNAKNAFEGAAQGAGLFKRGLDFVIANAKEAVIAFVAFSVIQNAVPAMINFGKAAFDTSLRLEAMQTALNNASGGIAEGGQQMAFINAEVDRLSLPLESSVQGFTQLAAAAKGTTLEGDKTKEMFSALAQAARVNNLSQEDFQAVLQATGQVLSKGSVQAEELRGQIGERLPGAFNKFAEAIGISTGELSKRLDQGRVGIDDYYKFTLKLAEDTAGGVGAANETAASSVARLGTEYTRLQKSIGDAIKPTVVATMNALSGALKLVAQNGPAVVAAFRGIAAALAVAALYAAPAAIAAITAALPGLISLAVVAATTLGPFVLAVGALAAACYVAEAGGKALGEAITGINLAAAEAAVGFDKDLNQAIAKLNKGISITPAELEKLKNGLAENVKNGTDSARTAELLTNNLERLQTQALAVEEIQNKLNKRLVESERAYKKASDAIETSYLKSQAEAAEALQAGQISQDEARKQELEAERKKTADLLGIIKNRQAELQAAQVSFDQIRAVKGTLTADQVKQEQQVQDDLTKITQEGYKARADLVKKEMEAASRAIVEAQTRRQADIQVLVNKGVLSEKQAQVEILEAEEEAIQQEIKLKGESAELTLKLLKNERQQQVAYTQLLQAQIQLRADAQINAYQRQKLAMQEVQNEQQQLLELYDLAAKAIEDQTKLIQAQQALTKAESDAKAGDLEIQKKLLESKRAEGQENFALEKQITDLAKQQEAAKREALLKEQQFARDNLEIEWQQTQLALEREKIANRLAKIENEANKAQNKADIAQAKADILKVEADKTLSGEEKAAALDAANLNLEAKQQQGVSLGQKDEILGLQDQALERRGQTSAQIYNKQRAALDYQQKTVLREQDAERAAEMASSDNLFEKIKGQKWLKRLANSPLAPTAQEQQAATTFVTGESLINRQKLTGGNPLEMLQNLKPASLSGQQQPAIPGLVNGKLQIDQPALLQKIDALTQQQAAVNAQLLTIANRPQVTQNNSYENKNGKGGAASLLRGYGR